MQVYIFTSAHRRTVHAFTPDASGTNLPTAYAPWRQDGWGTAVSVDAADPISVGIQMDGYLLVGA